MTNKKQPLEFTTPLEDDSLMIWGIHKGKELQNVPASYLFYVEAQYKTELKPHPFKVALLEYIENNRDVLDMEAAAQ